MSRTGTDENKAANTTNAAAAADANARTNAATSKYNADLSTLQSGQNIGANPFASPTYLSNLNRDYATTADATSNAAKANLQDTAMRTGDNSASTAAAIQNNQREAQRTANSGLNAQHSADFGRNLSHQQALLNSDLAPAGITNQQYSTSIGGQDAALGNLTTIGNASYGPWNAAISAAGAAVGAACPVEGSKILMADGSEKAVEEIVVGDAVLSQDGQPDVVLRNWECIQPCVEMVSATGKTAKCSESHSLVRLAGGYVNAKDAAGERVLMLGHHGEEIASVSPIGALTVYKLELNRSHAYCADGFWALE